MRPLDLNTSAVTGATLVDIKLPTLVDRIVACLKIKEVLIMNRQADAFELTCLKLKAQPPNQTKLELALNR